MALRQPTAGLEVRAAATLTAGTTATKTSAVPCFAMAVIVFSLTATNANALNAVAVIEVSDDGTNWINATTAGSGATSLVTMTTAAMNAGGTKALLFPIAGSSNPPRGVPWQFCRLSVDGHATLDITGLRVLAHTFDFQ